MDEVHHILKSNPEIALFVSLFLGYIIGQVKIKGFSLGRREPARSWLRSLSGNWAWTFRKV